MPIGPGHHATNPAKNAQNGPRALWVQTYSDPSSGNIRPSCAVTMFPGIRNVRNATIQMMNIDGPLGASPAELLMNSTMPTKMTVRSNALRCFVVNRTGASFSETIAR